jgi:hypothetical protein
MWRGNGMRKLWVKVKSEKDSDGKSLQVVEILESQPKDFSYIVFLEK